MADINLTVAPTVVEVTVTVGHGVDHHASTHLTGGDDAIAHFADTNNPHSVTKTQVGLGSVTNDAQLKAASNLSDVAVPSTAIANLGLGVPSSVTTRSLAATDNGKVLIASTSPTLTVPAGLPSGFGVAVRGTCTFTGSGATITDVRIPGSTRAWCALVATGTDTYDVVGVSI